MTIETSAPKRTLSEKHKLRVQIQNMRGIISRKKRGIKAINSREWEVRARNPNSGESQRIMVCPDEKTALAEYQKYIKNKLANCLERLKAISPNDPYLREEA